MTNSMFRQPEIRASTDATPAPTQSSQGTGRFSRFTYGTGKPKVTNVLGASNESVDWNNQTEEK